MKRSFSYLNEFLKLLGMLIWSSFISHVVQEIKHSKQTLHRDFDVICANIVMCKV